MIEDDHAPDAVQLDGEVEMVAESLAPLRIERICRAKGRAREDHMVVVRGQAASFHVARDLSRQAIIDACQQERLGLAGSGGNDELWVIGHLFMSCCSNPARL